MISRIGNVLFKTAVVVGLAIIILLMIFRLACECGIDPWGWFDNQPRIGEVLDNDI